MKISRVVELLQELQSRHGDIDVHVLFHETPSSRNRRDGDLEIDGPRNYTEEVYEVRSGRPLARWDKAGSAIVAVIEGE